VGCGYDAAASTLVASVSPSPSTRSKRVTRRALLAQRDSLSEADRAERSRKIAEAADAVLAQHARGGDIVAMYAAKGSEVDTTAIDAAARARGLIVAYPRVVDDAHALAFHAVRLDELVLARFGLREPPPEAPAIELARIAVFFVPGLAFDRCGGRIGWGRGHYDATLAAAPGARRVGLAFDFQVVDGVPREAHDTLLHEILTEVATYTVA
jgi:5-formyltetrahydrofolate cyclo-ligase